MVTTRKPASERKLEIVDATIALAGEMGPDRLTTEHLARQIGISQPAIFRHFPTKGDIWEAVAHRIAQLMARNMGSRVDQQASPHHRLKAMVITHLEFINATPAVPAILFSSELHNENEKLRAFFAGLMDARQIKLARLIREAGYSSKPHPNDAALLVLGLIQGLAMRWSLNARQFDLVGEGERLLELLLAGFGEPS